MSREDLKRRIETAKLSVTDKYAICRVAAKRLREAHVEMRAADERLGGKLGARAKNVYAAAEAEFKTALKEFSSFVARYDALVDEVMALYDELAAEDARGAHKIYAEAEKFEGQQSFQRERLFESLSGIEGIPADKNEAKDRTPWQKNESNREESLMDEHREHYVNRAPRAYTQPRDEAPQYYRAPEPPYYPAHQQVSLAPMSIDISEIVQDAVAAAMEKFKRAFEKRADSYIASIEPIPCKEKQEIAENAENSQIEGEVTEELSNIVKRVRDISTDMASLSSQYEALASSKEEAFSAMQKVNDIQRTTARELQGALAKQKVMSQDQAALSTEQAALAEQLKANLENHKLLLDVAAEISDMQKTISDAQEALKISMQELLASQKALISGHQAIIAANQKAAQASADITEKQAELNQLQRKVMSEHKHLAKKYKPAAKDSADEE